MYKGKHSSEHYEHGRTAKAGDHGDGHKDMKHHETESAMDGKEHHNHIKQQHEQMGHEYDGE